MIPRGASLSDRWSFFIKNVKTVPFLTIQFFISNYWDYSFRQQIKQFNWKEVILTQENSSIYYLSPDATMKCFFRPNWPILLLHTVNRLLNPFKLKQFWLQLHFSDWFGKKRKFVWCQINQINVITIQIWFNLTRFRNGFLCVHNITIFIYLFDIKS